MLPTPKLIGTAPRCASVCLSKDSAGVLPLKGENRRIVGTFPEEFSKDEAKRCMPKSNSAFRQKQNLNSTFMMSNGFQLTKFIPRHVSQFFQGCCRGCRACSHPVGARDEHGIQDGYNLAWKLALVLNGKADNDSGNLQPRTTENAKHLLQTTDRMFDIAAGSDWLLASPSHDSYAVHFSLSAGSIPNSSSSADLANWHSSRQSPSQHSGDEHFKVKAGDRMPYF